MNLARIIRNGSTYFPDREAIIFKGRSITYRQLNAAVDRAAYRLRDLGVGPGDRVGLYCENRPEWISLYYGLMRLGTVVVCISAAYRKTELDHLLRDSQPVCVLTSAGLADCLPPRESLPEIKDFIIIENEAALTDLDRPPADESIAPFPEQDRDPNDPCVILYTGGTTGFPKGAMLTHKNILFTAQNACYHERTDQRDRGLCFLPLYHVFAGNHIMNNLFYAGGTLVLHDGFDLDEIISSIEVNRVSRFYAVPTVYIRLLSNRDCHSRIRSVAYSFSAAASMPEEIVRQWRQTFGLNIHEAYGMTESSALATFNHLYRHKVGSVGTPAGIVEIRIVDRNDQPVPPGHEGEILISGPNVMKGYFNQPEETAKALAGGWLHSGDIGRMDEDGYLYIVDRLKDMIISGGLNVYPTEVENILYLHQAVEECAVVGRPDPEYGETVTAFVHLKQGCDCRSEELIRFCKENMASYKAPKKILFVDEFPRTPQGKLLKRELRKRL